MAFQKIEATNFYTVLLWFMVYAITHCFAESSTCLMVYKEGGAPAVFQSPKCPLWEHSDYTFQSPNAPHCQIAMHQGRRKYQEDRTLCALDVRIPFPSKTGLMEVPVGIIAVFDGHNGAEASEMASKILLEYFVVHTYFLLDATYSGIFKRPFKTFSNEREHGAIFNQLSWRDTICNRDLELGRLKYLLPANFDDDFHLEILKEALLRAIQDVDKTFSKEAHKNNLVSGSTATVILLADAQILVANIGDSKAFLCSEKFQSPAEAKATFLRLYKQKRYSGASRARGYGNSRPDSYDGLKHFYVKELTRDHHPDREDERSRVEIAGGHVVDWGGVPRVNGQLAISRAIGDVSFKSYGVISAPEVTDWQPLSANDSFLVASSDGIFEKLSSQDVCDLLWEIHNDGMSSFEHSPSCSYSLADCIVSTAFERGSMDNMAAIVVPLRPASSSGRFQEGSFVAQRDSSFPISGIENLIREHSGKGISSSAMQLEHSHPVMSKFNRLLVEGRHNNLGCFYLSENLDEYKDYMLRTQNEDEYVCDLPHALPDSLNQPYGTSLSKLMYSIENADEEKVEQKNHVQILRPSKWWHWLKTTEAGQAEMKNLIRQLLMALKSCHDRNITHRDIKPENMVICFEDQATGKCLNGSRMEDWNVSTKMRIIDFGSAIDEFTVKHLYGSTGPSRAEQTYDYTPPEALLNSSWYQEMSGATLKYDMWSVGVVMLELILGSPNVFQVSDLTRVLLDQHLQGWNDGLKQLAYKLRSFMELCILIPGSSSRSYQKNGHQGDSPASWQCSEEVFARQIKSRDPLKLGFPNVWALRLVRNLLQWNPVLMPTVRSSIDALFFVS
uniref:PPM-type phosphatase domain-containing protein n=1 Tax=Cucumis sativus TaxID=3659 RepID=A0A0A0LLR7_CUCSA